LDNGIGSRPVDLEVLERPRRAGKGAEAMQHFTGCDVHTRNQVVAWIEEETGEIKKRRSEHAGEEVRKFFAQFPPERHVRSVVPKRALTPRHWKPSA